MGFDRRNDPEAIPAFDQCDMSGHLPGLGKQEQLPKIKQALLDLPFLLKGPAGSGKKHLLFSALQGRPHTSMDLSMISYENGSK